MPAGSGGHYCVAMSFPEAARPAAIKSPLLGQASLALIISAVVAASFAMVPIASAMGDYIKATGSTTMTPAAAELISASVSGSMAVFQFSTYVGIASAITGLIAAITNRGRIAGAIAAGLGFLGPIVPVLVGVVLLFPIFQAVA